MQPSYQKVVIPSSETSAGRSIHHEMEDSPARDTARTLKVSLVSLVSLALIILGLYSVQNQSPLMEQDIVDVDMEASPHGTSSVRDCTFDECLHASCDHTLAPFICLFHNGGPHGGCSPTEWTKETCSESCNLEACDTLEVPDDVVSCTKKACELEWCQIGQLCGSTAPYQCTEGTGRFGCSDDPLHWIMYGCECCDTTTC